MGFPLCLWLPLSLLCFSKKNSNTIAQESFRTAAFHGGASSHCILEEEVLFEAMCKVTSNFHFNQTVHLLIVIKVHSDKDEARCHL